MRAIGRNRTRSGALAFVLALTASGCGFVVVEHSNPGAPPDAVVIFTPENRIQVTTDDLASLELAADLVDADPGSVGVTVDTGADWGDPVDITGEMDTIESDYLRGPVDPGHVEPGITRIAVSAETSQGRVTRDVVFSWEPEIDTSLADRCELLGQTRCQLPFPSDRFTIEDASTDTGRRISFGSESLVQNVAGVAMDPTEWNRNDGFSPGQAAVTLVPGVDLGVTGAAPITDIGRSLDPDQPIVLLDATTGQRHPFWAELDATAGSDATRTLIVRPARNYPEGHRMIVGLRNLKRSDGSIIEPSRAFQVYRDGIPTFLPEIEARRDAMNDLIGRLGEAGVGRSELYLAWDFTVASERSISERALHIRDDAFASLGDAAPSFAVTDVVDDVNADVWRRVSGTYVVPSYLTGNGAPGSRFSYPPGAGPDALPSRNGEFTAAFVCNIPRSVTSNGADPVTPGRALVYGHGLLGSKDEVNGFGAQADDTTSVMCATSWVGMSTEDIPNVVSILDDLSKFPTLADRLQQSFLNQMFLARLMKDPDGFASHVAFQAGVASTSVIAPGEVFFNGNSQGGILGGAATALSTEWTRAVLGVPGMNFSTLLTRSVHWDTFGGLSRAAYPDDVDQVLGQQLIQMLWDRAEANGYAHHMTSDPLPGTPEHTVMLLEAFGDHQVANVATETEARTVPGMHVWQPALGAGRSPDVVAVWDVPAVTSAEVPWGGSVLVIWDWGTDAPPTTNTPNRAGDDPHGFGAGEPGVMAQVDQFLRSAGAFWDLCEGGPCRG